MSVSIIMIEPRFCAPFALGARRVDHVDKASSVQILLAEKSLAAKALTKANVGSEWLPTMSALKTSEKYPHFFLLKFQAIAWSFSSLHSPGISLATISCMF